MKRKVILIQKALFLNKIKILSLKAKISKLKGKLENLKLKYIFLDLDIMKRLIEKQF